MKQANKLFAVALASVLVVGQVQPTWALKGFLKNMVDAASPVSTTPATTATTAATAHPAATTPTLYTNEKFGYKAMVDAGWNQMDGSASSNTAMFFDQHGKQGSFQVNATWMASDFPIQASLQAMAKQNEERVKHGDLVKYYRKDFTVKNPDGKTVTLFQGYVTIETNKDSDPDIQRMQWIGYGKGNYYNFTWATKPENFAGYQPVFESQLNKIEFIR